MTGWHVTGLSPAVFTTESSGLELRSPCSGYRAQLPKSERSDAQSSKRMHPSEEGKGKN
jgi:hypothetical protein